MELILWRHAEAVDGFPDHDRTLTDKGRRQAERMAHFLAGRLPQDTRILVSPALRAQQTAAALTRHFTTEPAIGTGADAQRALAASGWPDAEQAVLLVGHQPWLGELAALLLSGAADAWSVKKGAVWWFSHKGNDQTALRLVIAPDQL
jgi:phosphohistidine phosphatase